MNDYILSCCSTADLTKEHFLSRGISYICFHFNMNGVTYTDDLGESMSFEDFYAAVKDGADVSTSQVTMGEYHEYFRRFLEEGKDILHVCLSSGISGSYGSACLAAKELMEEYPERKLYIVDSLGASSGYGLLMDTLADLRDSGMGITELHDWAEEHKLNVHHWFFSSDLTNYIKGGRISKAAGLVGSVLHICPLLNMDNLGRLIPRQKVRTKNRVIKEIVDKMEQCADGGQDYSGKCYISNSGCYKDARAVADLVEERFKHLNGRVEINSVGTTIGSHTGCGTVALFFFGKPREG